MIGQTAFTSVSLRRNGKAQRRFLFRLYSTAHMYGSTASIPVIQFNHPLHNCIQFNRLTFSPSFATKGNTHIHNCILIKGNGSSILLNRKAFLPGSGNAIDSHRSRPTRLPLRDREVRSVEIKAQPIPPSFH